MARQLNGLALAAATPARRAALLVLTLVVIGVHGCVTQGVVDRMADFSQPQLPVARIEVAYVREMELAAPPAAAAPEPVVVAARPKKVRPKPPKPASAPEPAKPAEPAPEPLAVAAAEPASEPPSEPVQDPMLAQAASAASAFDDAASTPWPAAASDVPASAPNGADTRKPRVAAAAASPASNAASGIPAFEWPASTRVSYVLTGNYRGEVKGSAQVEWVRVGSRYQVHLDFLVGPSFAPVVQRRMTSDGEITPDGLMPRRYDEETKVLMGAWRRRSIVFDDDTVLLPNGQRRPRVAGVQDTASQFVQLTYLYSIHPERLRVGTAVDIPLALAHKVDVWTYDVVAEDTLYTTFGQLQAFHLKPRRPPDATANTLSVDIWLAPQLRYLPARLYVTQDAHTYADLMIERKPEMAGP